MEIYQAQARIFKTLMHPGRLAILDVLRDGEQCVCHMEAALGCRQAFISQHLAVLREAGIVADRRDGWNIFYRVVKPEVYSLLADAYLLAVEGTSQLEYPRPRPQAANCPCPKCNPDRAVIEGAHDRVP